MDQFYDKYIKSPSAKDRRSLINQEMSSLENSGFSCKDCIGNCCTFSSNSMMISPLEAFDILNFLKADPTYVESDLIKKLEQTILDYRLNILDIRRTYTCPFYKGIKKGCAISRHAKPYGCLAFLPNEKNITQGNSCNSKLNLMKKTQNKFKSYEDELNELLENDYGISWKKLPIPNALLQIIKKGANLAPL